MPGRAGTELSVQERFEAAPALRVPGCSAGGGGVRSPPWADAAKSPEPPAERTGGGNRGVLAAPACGPSRAALPQVRPRRRSPGALPLQHRGQRHSPSVLPFSTAASAAPTAPPPALRAWDERR